jgi:hypothetical protein
MPNSDAKRLIYTFLLQGQTQETGEPSPGGIGERWTDQQKKGGGEIFKHDIKRFALLALQPKSPTFAPQINLNERTTLDTV